MKNEKASKLKVVIEKYIAEATEDLLKNMHNIEKFEVIDKYRKKLVDIKNVCETRNRF